MGFLEVLILVQPPSPPPDDRRMVPQPLSDEDNHVNDTPATIQAQTPATTLKHKHSTISSSNNNSSIKRIWPLGATALHNMNDKLEEFTNVFQEVFTGKKSGLALTPQQKAKAMQHAQEIETSLSDQRMVRLIDLFHADITMADTYLSLQCEGVRKGWVDHHVKDLADDHEQEEDWEDLFT